MESKQIPNQPQIPAAKQDLSANSESPVHLRTKVPSYEVCSRSGTSATQLRAAGDRWSASILPRQGWQNQRAFAQAMVKAKRALDIAEITHLLQPFSVE